MYIKPCSPSEELCNILLMSAKAKEACLELVHSFCCFVVWVFWTSPLTVYVQRYVLVQSIFCSTDINECQNLNGGCEQECVDSEGSYSCQCYMGYTNMEGNRFHCEGKLYLLKISQFEFSTHGTNFYVCTLRML